MNNLNETILHENRQLAFVELVNNRFGGFSARCAEALGMSHAVISAWSTGTKTLCEKDARNIESLLGIPDEALVKCQLGYFESWDGQPVSMSTVDPSGDDSHVKPLVAIRILAEVQSPQNKLDMNSSRNFKRFLAED